MIFTSRAHIESVGKAGVEVVTDALGVRGKQLDSFWLYTDPEDAGYTKHALGDGYWESWITLWMDFHVKADMTVLDIGANHGYYSFFLASKGCKVYAYEPQPKLAELIKRSNEANEFKVEVEQVAISNTTEPVFMMVPTHHGMNATISNQHSYAPDGYEYITVPTTTLDALDVDVVDFIKVDAEGAEDLIWAGSHEFRKRNPNCLWLMEWRWDRYTDPAGFGAEILEANNVSYVDFSGMEFPMNSVEQLATKQDEDWMLVLRGK